MIKVTIYSSITAALRSHNRANPGHKLDMLMECTWILFIFLLPVCFNPFGYDGFYLAKTLLLQFSACLLLGEFLARWLLSKQENSPVDAANWIKRSPLQTAVLLYAVFWCMATVFSIMPEESLWGSLARKNGLMSMLSWIAIFIVMIQKMVSRRQLYRALYVLFVSTTLVSLLGIIFLIFPQMIPGYSFQVNGRALSTDGNPLSLSAFLSMVLPITLALLILDWYKSSPGMKRTLKLVGLLTAFTLQMACLCMAQYSITVLLFIPGIFIFFLMLGVFQKSKPTVVLSALVLLVLITLAGVMMGQMMMSRPGGQSGDPQAEQDTMAGQVGLNTLGIRTDIWKCAVAVIIDRPEVPFYHDNVHYLRHLIGYGPESFVVLSQSRYPVVMKSQDVCMSMLLGQPENNYLHLAATIGILGLGAFLSVVLVFYYLGFCLIVKAGSLELVALTSALVAGMAQFCAYTMFNATAPQPEFMFWLTMSLMVVLTRTSGSTTNGIVLQESSHDHGMQFADNNKSRKLRGVIAALVLLAFIAMGAALTCSQYLADLKLRAALDTWSKDVGSSIQEFIDATQLEPNQAVYHGYLGSTLYSLAVADNDTEGKARLLTVSTAAYEKAASLEPYLAYWSYTMGDMNTYWAGHTDAGRWKDALRYYERADIMLPENAAILNKWALALMLSGDYAEAGRKLSESRDADGEWIQTTFYTGLLEVYERCYCSAGYCFVYPVEQKPGNIEDYISFCSRLGLYGGLDKVIEGLKVYTACQPDDWIGQALLGIAEVYENKLDGAAESFSRAAHSAPLDDALTLKEIVTRMGVDNPDFEPAAQEIVDSLAQRILDSIKQYIE